ncbi:MULTISPECIES: aldo/keto reductase [unclassified Nocardiopsis]|uniref:aldo/keto reductase n=1 Tax=unclassified Nocardiopsis TaxID=2649073 RepID=UPI00135C525A|nr:MULTISPECIES: aldo/keto reductase [unclassified Nocardiopsis]
MPHQGQLHTRLGRTGLHVSRLCLGTVNFGGRVEEPEAGALLDHALARGIDFIDTADMYGWRVHRGFTEEMIGRWLARSPSRRDAVVLATKVGNPVGEGPNDGGLSARHIISACEASLRRLGTEWIDLYQMHRMDPGVVWDEVWQAMETLTAQGKIRYVGSSNFSGWGLASCQESALRRGFLGLASEQCLYNLVTRQPELETVPAASAYGIGVLVWSPLHGGLLSGALHKRSRGTAVKSAQGRAESALPRHRRALEAFEDLCKDLERDPAEVGLSWVLTRPGVTSAVIGPRTPEHVDGALRALAEPLDASALARLDALFPPIGRGGPAPDAWLE